ncbi:MAG: hypothetical protein ACOCQD_05480 [archaeon]
MSKTIAFIDQYGEIVCVKCATETDKKEGTNIQESDEYDFIPECAMCGEKILEVSLIPEEIKSNAFRTGTEFELDYEGEMIADFLHELPNYFHNDYMLDDLITETAEIYTTTSNQALFQLYANNVSLMEYVEDIGTITENLQYGQYRYNHHILSEITDYLNI